MLSTSHRFTLAAAALTVGCADTSDPEIDRTSSALSPIAGPACLTSSVGSLDFGEQLTGTLQPLALSFTSCDGEPVTIHKLGVRDGTDFILQARVLDLDGVRPEITPRLPYTLAPSDELWLVVTYRAQASAYDAQVSRHLQVVADSRETPTLPGTLTVGLVGQPRTACPDDECGGAWSDGAGYYGPLQAAPDFRNTDLNADPHLGQLGPFIPPLNPHPPGPPPSPW